MAAAAVNTSELTEYTLSHLWACGVLPGGVLSPAAREGGQRGTREKTRPRAVDQPAGWQWRVAGARRAIGAVIGWETACRTEADRHGPRHPGGKVGELEAQCRPRLSNG